MGLITYKPTTPSYRKTVKIDKSQLFKGRPEKSLIEDLQPNSGRNNTGKITIRHRSGGHKKKYRLINFKRNTFDKIGTVERIEYDPNRSAFIALINYQDIKEYIIAPTDLKIGEKVILMSSSTGGTISSTSALDRKLSQKILGYIFLSPNFGINNNFASLISWPFSQYWLKLILGKTMKHNPRNDLNKKYWTMSYTTNALIPMAKLVNEVNDRDYSKVKKPALFYFSMDDKVVDPKKIKKFISNWGGKSTTKIVKLSNSDDKYSHVLAGDIISPNQTEHAKKTILAWIKNLK